MRILLILANYFPVHNPNVYRFSAVAKQWTKQGHEVVILTTKISGAEIDSSQEGVRICRTGYASLLDIYNNATRTQEKRNIPQSSKTVKTNSKTEKLVDLTWRTFYWPDGARPFLAPGIKLGRKILKEKDTHLIVSVGLPYTCHLIARNLKKEFPNIRWHMDIEDPFCYSKNFGSTILKFTELKI